jgi:acyl dehydratase
MIEWFDDLSLGMRFKSKEVQITRNDIKRFAVEFDPQPFHLDEAAAEHRVKRNIKSRHKPISIPRRSDSSISNPN